MKILTENEPIFKRITNHTTKGAYHSQIAIILRNLATADNRQEYFRRAIREYDEADREFRLARNPIFRADVKNNVGFLLFKLSRFKEAHKYLDEARRLSVSFKDKARTAQIDESSAQVFIAQGKFKEGEATARRAALALEKAGHQCLVADALITQGIALARLHQAERAQLIFQRAIDVAYQVDAFDKAAIAALTMIEEIGDLPPVTLQAAYERARAWLSKSTNQEVLLRLGDAAKKLAASVHVEIGADEAMAVLSTKPGDLQESMLKYEASLIKRALFQANGSVTRAALLLGTSYQALCYILETRQKHLMKERSPVRRRRPPRKEPQEKTTGN